MARLGLSPLDRAARLTSAAQLHRLRKFCDIQTLAQIQPLLQSSNRYETLRAAMAKVLHNPPMQVRAPTPSLGALLHSSSS